MSLAFEGVSYAYENAAAPVLSHISFTVGDGSLTGICGSTGSGKTTLLNLAAGLLQPSAGTICIDDAPVNNAADGARCGIVFQYPERQLFRPTVREDVGFGPANLGLSREEIAAHVAEALRQVGLNPADVLDRSPFELSGGQQRLVAIAGVLAMRPHVFMLDEPTAGLDARTRHTVLQLLDGLARKGASVLVTSHDMDALAAHCDHIVMLDAHGHCTAGEPAALFANAEALAACGLEQPFTYRFAQGLASRGLVLQSNPATIDELAWAIAERC